LEVGLGAVIHISWKLNCLEAIAIGRPCPKKGQWYHRRKGRLFMMLLIAIEDCIV